MFISDKWPSVRSRTIINYFWTNVTIVPKVIVDLSDTLQYLTSAKLCCANLLKNHHLRLPPHQNQRFRILDIKWTL